MSEDGGAFPARRGVRDDGRVSTDVPRNSAPAPAAAADRAPAEAKPTAVPADGATDTAGTPGAAGAAPGAAQGARPDGPDTPKAPEPARPGPSGAPAARRRGLESVWNMVISTALICVAAFVLYFFGVPHDESGNGAQTVDYEVPARTAARAAPYPLLVPAGLDEDWQATSVSYDPEAEYGATWRVGFLTPDEEYVALAQAPTGTDPEAFIASITHDAQDAGTAQTVAGQDWTRYEGPKYDALVLRQDEATTIVFGTARFAELGDFAGTLTTVDAGVPAEDTTAEDTAGGEAEAAD